VEKHSTGLDENGIGIVYCNTLLYKMLVTTLAISIEDLFREKEKNNCI